MLIVIHLLILAHVLQWWISGKTITPVEPSEAMYTLNEGQVNAGFFFFLAAISATVLLGRFVCGWGCHFLAYQDACAWFLKKVGIRPKPLRSRILAFGPLLLALYMFVWPSAYRWFVGREAPALTNHMLTTEFWKTFPGPVMAIATITVAGMLIIYFLGSKGFCTYACPYGAFFGLADSVAPGRIRVTDACNQCGHCTAACTSNVRVHDEVARFQMVVDPGCMKCMDCLSVCPNDALYFGFGRPAIGAKAVRPGKAPRFDFSLSGELCFVALGIAALLAYRGLYDQIPLLLAMAMAVMFAFMAVKSAALLRVTNVRLQNLQLRRGGRWTRSGWVFALAFGGLALFTAHSAVIQWNIIRGERAIAASGLDDRIWTPGGAWRRGASESDKAQIQLAMQRLQRADSLGILPTPSAMKELVRANVAMERYDVSVALLERLALLRPKDSEVFRGLGNTLLRINGRGTDAVAALRKARSLDPDSWDLQVDLFNALLDLGMVADSVAEFYGVNEASDRPLAESEFVRRVFFFAESLAGRGRWLEAEGVLKNATLRFQENPRLLWRWGVALIRSGDARQGIQHLRKAVTLDPNHAESCYDLSMALLQVGATTEAIEFLQKTVRLNPDFALAHYNLAVGCFMVGNAADAVVHVREAVRLNPKDPDAHGFLGVVLESLGDRDGAASARNVESILRK